MEILQAIIYSDDTIRSLSLTQYDKKVVINCPVSTVFAVDHSSYGIYVFYKNSHISVSRYSLYINADTTWFPHFDKPLEKPYVKYRFVRSIYGWSQLRAYTIDGKGDTLC
jgi:hypothetical protein